MRYLIEACLVWMVFFHVAIFIHGSKGVGQRLWLMFVSVAAVISLAGLLFGWGI